MMERETSRIIWTRMNFAAGEAVIGFDDGREAVHVLETDGETGNVASVTVPIHGRTMEIATAKGDRFEVELPPAEAAATLAGRPTVHLDTKDWRTLRDVVYDQAGVAAAERGPGLALVEAALEKRVVLVLSSGVVAEAASWDDHRRYEQAVTMARLCRGWQMRQPREVIVRELRAAMWQPRGVPRAYDVVTLSPGAALNQRPTYQAPNGAPASWQTAGEAVVAMSSLIATLIDPDATPRGDIDGWVTWQQGLTDFLRNNDVSREEADREINLFLLADTRPEIAQAAMRAGLTDGRFSAWLEHRAENDMGRTPSLALFREALREKHLNAHTTWRKNDLADLAYLCCAAVYCDHASGDRAAVHTVGAAARRLGRTVSVHRRLADLVAALEI